MSESKPAIGAGPTVRFGRSEQGRSGILWSVYEALEDGDFENGVLVASFLRWEDAGAFMRALPERPDSPHACPHGQPFAAECKQCQAAFRAGVDAAVRPCDRCGGSGRVKHGDIGCSRPCPNCA